MPVSELNEDTQDQICDLLENLQQIEKLKNKDIRILLDKIVRQYGGKVINKWNDYYIIDSLFIINRWEPSFLMKYKGFNLTQGMALLLLKPLNLPSNFVLNLIIYITNPRNNIGY